MVLHLVESNTSDLCSCLLELCSTCGTAGIDPRRVSILGGINVAIAGTFVASSILSAPDLEKLIQAVETVKLVIF